MDTTGTIEMALESQMHKIITFLHKYYTTIFLDYEYIAISQADMQRLDEYFFFKVNSVYSI